MAVGVSEAVDMAGSLALVVVLSHAYGAMNRRVTGNRKRTEILLGILFGMVAIMQMNSPITPMEGLIIDMRNVPVALAFAFLGWRSALSCLLIAAAARWQIGGVGMTSGLVGLCLAAAGARWWMHIHRNSGRRYIVLVGLGVAMSAHLAGAMLLPPEAQHWFLTHAALPVFLLNMISVPVAAAFLEAEQQRIQLEETMAAAARTEPKTGLLLWAAFKIEVTNRVFAGGDLGARELVIIDIRNRSWLATFCGCGTDQRVLGALGVRMSQLCVGPHTIGLTPCRRIAVALNEQDAKHVEHILRTLERDIAEFPITLDDTCSAHIRITTQRHIVPQGPRQLSALLETLSNTVRPNRVAGAKRALSRPEPQTRPDGDMDRWSKISVEHTGLFEKLDRMMTPQTGKDYNVRSKL